jgi:hypothetical protein
MGFATEAQSWRLEAGGLTYTFVATGSMRNWLGAEGIEALCGPCDDGSKGDRAMRMYPPTPGVLQKRLQAIDLMGVDFFGRAKEAARV